MTASGYLYVIKKNGSFGSEYTLLKDRVYNLGSNFRCHLRFPLKGFFGTACSISTNKTGAAILKKLAPYRVLLNNGVIASPKKLKFGDIFQVGHKVFKWDRLKHNSVQKFTYSSKTPRPAISNTSARKEVRRKSAGDFRSRLKSSIKSTVGTWKETHINVAASTSEFSKMKRNSKSRSNQKLVTSESETKQLKLNINIPKHVYSNQLTPTSNTKDLPPQLKSESIKKAESLKKSMALLSKRKHSDDSSVKMAKKIKLPKDLMDESAGDYLVESEASNFDDSLSIAPDSPLTISSRRSVRVDDSPTINSRKSLFNDLNISGIKTLMETPLHKVNTSNKSRKQELNESLNIFETTSSLNKKVSGSKSTGKKLKQPAKSSRFSLSTRKAPRSRLIPVKTKTPTQLSIALKSVSVIKKSARKTPKVKTTPLGSASKRLSKMYKSPKSPAMKTPKKEVSFSISPKGKCSPDAWTPINVPIETSPLLNGSPIKIPKNSPKISTSLTKISSPIKTPAKSSPRKSSQNNSFNISPLLKASPVKTPKNSLKASTRSARIFTSSTPKINLSAKKTPAKSSSIFIPIPNSLSSKKIINLEELKVRQTPKNASPVKVKLSTRRSSQNIAFNYSELFEDSPIKTPNFKALRSVRISASPRNSFPPKKTPQIKTSPRSPKNNTKVSTSSARTSTSAKKSPIKISPRKSQHYTLNLNASSHKTPQINISDQLIQFSPLKTPKVGVASTSTGRASRSVVLHLTPTNKTLQQISPVLTSTGKVKKSSKNTTPSKLSATKTKTLKNELLNSSPELLFKTPTQQTTPARTRSTRKAPKSTSTTAARLCMEVPIENVSFSFVTTINSPAAVQRTTRNTESAKKSLNTRDYSRISKTPILQIKNSPNISAKIGKSPKNDLTDVKGVKSLMKTPDRQQRSPKNDLTDVKGVKALMKTPDRQQRSPKNDLTDVKGVKSLMKTPGRQQRSPKNDLTDVRGVKSLMRTPEKKQQKSPQNDLSDLRGVKQLMNPLRSPKSPFNDLTNITSVKNLFRTSTGHVKSPTNDLTNVQGVKRLMNPFRSPKTHANDLTDIEGVKELFNSPTTVQLTTRQSVGNFQMVKPLAIISSTEKNITTPDMNNLLFDSIKGAVDDNTGNFELKKSIMTYERKNKTLSPVKQPPPRTNNRKSLQHNVAVNYVSIQKWVDECTQTVSQMLPLKPKIEEPTVLTPIVTRRNARLLRGEDCTPTPEKPKPARKKVSRRKVAIATDFTDFSETVEPSPQRTWERLANVETEVTDLANNKKLKRFQFEEPALHTPESSPRSKRGRSALMEKAEEEPEVKSIRDSRKAAKKEESSTQKITEVTEVKAVRGRRKAVKKVEEKEPIREEKSVRGRRNASKKQVEKEDEESKPVRKPRVGRSAKNKNLDKENIAVKLPEKSDSPAIKKRENRQEPKEEKIIKTARVTRTTKKGAEGKESAEVEKNKPTRDNEAVTASQEGKEVSTTRTTRKKKIVEETSPKPAPRTTRRKK